VGGLIYFEFPLVDTGEHWLSFILFIFHWLTLVVGKPGGFPRGFFSTPRLRFLLNDIRFTGT
jgi:hypothetical protein